MNKNNKIIIAAIAVVALLLVIGALFASGILSGNDDDKNTISYEVSFIDGDDVIKTLNVNENNSVSRISDPEKEGYIFTGWYSDKELTNEFDFENTRITENTNIYAKWVKASEPEPGDITFTVTFNTDGASSIASQTVKEGEKAVKPADPLKSGYKFEGWYSDSSFTTKFDFKTPITFDITLYAKFTASQGGGGGGGSITPPPVTDKIFTVTFESNGSILSSQTVKEGKNVTKPTADPKRDGYTFAGWYSNSSFTTKFDFNSAITDDTTLYAKWVIGDYKLDEEGKKVTVTFNPDQINGIISADSEIIEIADTSNYENASTVNISNDLLISIQNKNEANKDLSVNTAKGSLQLSSNIVDSIIGTGKEKVSITIDTMPGSETKYSIEITSGGEQITQFPETITISIPYTLKDGENPQDIVVYYIDKNTNEYLVHGTYNKEIKCVDIKTNHLSTYEIRNDAKYSINFILNGGAFDSNFKSSDYMKKEFNSLIKEIDPSKAGYKFLGWFKDESLKTAWNFKTDTVKTLDESDLYTINLYAKWEAVSYDITYNLNEGINSSANPASYTIESETITFENPTKLGYTFKGWFTDESFKNQITSIVKGSSEEISLYAKWEINKYSVTLSSGTGYELVQLQNSSIVEYGDDFQFKLSINDDFKQSSPVVKSNGMTISAVNETYTIPNISENQVVTVEGIETNSYDITFANKDGFYTVDNDGPVSSGENFTFAITLDDAYSQSPLTESSVKVFGKYGSVSKTGENVNQYAITNVTSDIVVLVEGLKKNEYVVTFISDDDIILEQKVNHGDSASLINNLTKPGYTLNGWYLDREGNDKYTTQEITKDTTLYAKWNAGTTNYFVYTYQEKVSYTSDANKYELIHVDQKSDSVGKTVPVDWGTYHTEDILGSTKGFEPNKSISNTSGVISAENPLILKLYFDRKEFKMTFNAPDGSQFESVSEIKAKYGQPVSPIRVTLPDGYTLDHWYESDKETPYLFTTMPDRNVTLHSKYTAIYYLEYDANGGAGDLPYKIGYTNGTEVILFGPNYPTSSSYILTKEGYTFGGWKYDGKTYQPGESFTMPTNDITLKADWTPITYEVQFDGNGSTSGSMTDQTFTYDAAQDLTANVFERTGYTFAGWSDTLGGSVKYADKQSVINLASTGRATVTLYAVWQINQYTITFNSNGGSEVESITADYNTSVTLPAPTREGHAFAGWYSDESLNTKYTSDKIPAEDITLYAKWTANSYYVTFHYNNGDNNKTELIEFNTSIIEPTNVSKLGYTLKGWYSDANFNTKWEFASNKMPAHDIDLYAKWTATSYTVNFYNETESISLTTYTVESDSIQMPSNPSKTGYTFKGWFDSTLTNEFSYIKGTTVGNIDLYAKFTINQYVITFNSNGGSAAESITAEYNASVTLPTPIREGYTFDGWYSDEELTIKYISDKMPDENITLYANWTKNSYILTINYVYEDGSKVQDSYVNLVEYGETYTVASPPIESFLPDIPTVTGTMPANDLIITVTYGEYLINVNGTNYRTIEDALISAQEGDRLILLRDYTIQKDITIPKGILLVLPCSDDDIGYDLTAEYEDDHNPDGTSTNKGDLSVLYRTLTIPSGVTLNIEGQLLVNAITGRPAAGHYDMDITGGYSQIILEGDIVVQDGAILEVCGIIDGNGRVTAESGSEIRELYVVKNWRGGSQAYRIFPSVFPFNEYDCHSIQAELFIKSGALVSGNVKMYAQNKFIPSSPPQYFYVRFPQIGENGLIQLAADAHLVRTYDADATNGSSDLDRGRTNFEIYGGATFSHSTLKIVSMDLSTKNFTYPLDGDISIGLHNGNYISEDNFKIMTGSQISIYADASLTVLAGKHLVFYDEFDDIDNVDNTEYPDRPAALLLLHDGAILNINGSFAGIIERVGSGTGVVNISNADSLTVITKEANGSTGTPTVRELIFNTKYQYTLTLNYNNGTEQVSMKYITGEDINLPDPVETGYDFKGWYLDSDYTEAIDVNSQISGNLTLYAKWEVSKYTVTFNSNCDNIIESQILDYNSLVKKPENPTKLGYEFMGWYLDNQEYEFSTPVTYNITLSAEWKLLSYTISYELNGGSNHENNPLQYDVENPKVFLAPLKTGHTFEGWYTDAEFFNRITGTSGKAENLTLYANWTINPYTITLNYMSDEITNGTVTVEYNSTLDENNINKDRLGYTLTGWYRDSSYSTPWNFNEDKVINHVTIYAKWNAVPYAISYELNGGAGGLENPDSYTIESETITLNDPAKLGYKFLGWYATSDFSGNQITEIVKGSTGDKTLYANWEAVEYTVSFVNWDDSEISSKQYYYSDTVTAPISPERPSDDRYNYTFSGWDKEIVSVTENATYKAVYTKTPIDYTISYELNDGDNNQSNPDKYNCETATITLNDPAKLGYKFLGWFTDESFENQITEIVKGSTGNKTLYAGWEILTFSIAIPTSSDYTISYVGSTTVDYGSNFEFTITVDEMYDINSIIVKSNGVALTKSNEKYVIENITENQTISVEGIEKNSYNITIPQGEGFTLTPSSDTVAYGESVTFTFKLDDAYSQSAYIIKQNGSSVTLTNNQFTIDNVTSDISITVEGVKKNTYSVTFEYDNGSQSATETITHGNAVAKPADPTKKGYNFADWTLEGSSYDFNTLVTGNITLKANWTPITYHVQFNGNGSTSGEMTNQTFTYDEAQDLTANAFERTGYTFAGWSDILNGSVKYTDNESVNNLASTEGATVTLYAVWTSISYTITYDANTGSGSIDNQPAVYGSSINLSNGSELSKTGYSLIKWNTQADGSGTDYNLNKTFQWNIDGDLNLYAVWEIITYSITYELNEGTNNSDNPASYTIDTETITLKDSMKSGYTFLGWYAISDFSGNKVTEIVKGSTGSITLYAKWEQEQYLITFNTNGGSPQPSQMSYKVGDDVAILTILSKNGYSFEGWYTDSACTQPFVYSKGTTTGNINLYAKWALIEYTITYELSGGSVSGNPTSYTIESETITINNPTKTGYRFSGWSGTDISETTTNLQIQKDSTGNRTYTANWTPISYQVHFDGNGSTSGEMTNQIFTYDAAQNLTENAFVKTGYTFAGWSDTSNGSVIHADNVSVNNLASTDGATVILYAIWSINHYTVTLPNNALDGVSYTTAVIGGYDASSVEHGKNFKFTVTFGSSIGNNSPVIAFGEKTVSGTTSDNLTFEFIISNVTDNLSLSLQLVPSLENALKELVNQDTSSDYKLMLEGTTLTVSIINPNADVSGLIGKVSAATSQEVPVNSNSGRTGITSFLAYLPNDDTLWADNLADYTVNLAGCTIVFKQDADAIEEAKIRYLTEIAQAVRVFRSNPEYYPFLGSIPEILSTSVGVEANGCKYIDIGVLLTYSEIVGQMYGNDGTINIMVALMTNYSTVVALVGHQDAKYGKYDLNQDFTKNQVTLGKNLTDMNEIMVLYQDALSILNDMGIPISTINDPIRSCFDADGNGYGGYGQYYCISSENELRYTDVYHLKFSNHYDTDGSNISLHNIGISENIINKISLQNFKTDNSLIYIPFDFGGRDNFSTEIIQNIRNYEYAQLVAGDLVVINFNEGSEYTIKDLNIMSTSGEIKWYNNNSFIMPDGDVTISLKTSSEAETPVITGSPNSPVQMTAGDSASLTVSASVSDGGSLSYAWYAATGLTDKTVDETKKVASSATYTIPADKPEGVHYYFCVVTNTLGTASSTSTSNVVTVQITSQTYSISFETNGGSSIDAVAYRGLKQGTALSLPSSERFGYQFDGWYSDAALSVQAPAVMPAENLTLYAKWNNALSPDGSIAAFENDATHPWIIDETMAGSPAYIPSNCGMENTKSTFSFTVSGPGKLYFYCQSFFLNDSTANIYVDKDYKADLISDYTWGLKYVDIIASGEHTVSCEYSMSVSAEHDNEYKAWIKDIVFVPAGKTTANIDVDIKAPLGSDTSTISITGLTLGTNTVSIGSKMPVIITSPDNLAFVGWQDGNDNWIGLQDSDDNWVFGNGIDEFITDNELTFTAFYDLSMTAVFLKKEQILPEITVSQNGGNPTKISDGLNLEYASSAANSVFSFNINANDPDVNISASLNGSKIELSGNTFNLQNITEYSELVITATKNECLTQTLSVFFKPLYSMPNLCLDNSVDSVYTFGYHKWALDSSITDRVAYKSTNQNLDLTWSSFAVEVTGSGKLSFDYCVSSESNYDILLYNIDQEVTSETMDTAANYGNMENYSGETGWKTEVITITAADTEKTVIYFAYCKGGSTAHGQDTSWISNIRFAQGAKTITLTAPDSSAGTVTGTYNSSNLTIGENKIDPETEVSLTAAPSNGYQFYGWIDGNGRLLSPSNTYSFTVLGDVTLTAVFALKDTYAARNGGTWYTSLEEALNAAASGNTVVLLKDYTLTQSVTVPNGVFLVLPCSDGDVGYDLTAEYGKEHNPDGTSTSTTDLSILYRTLTIPSDITLTVEGQVLINAVTGRPGAGHHDMDVTGNYSQIILNGNISVENGAILEACGYIKGDGQITAKNGSEVRDTYVVKNWRGGSQALDMYNKTIFPFNEYDCNNIRCTLYIEASASLSGNVKMYASSSYHYTRFPQVDQVNGLIRLADGAHLVKTYDVAAINGTSAADTGRTTIQIYGGATFASSALKLKLSLITMDLSTDKFIYPVDGDISFELHNGNYVFNNDFKFLTGATVTVDSDATLTVSEGKTVVFYNEFNDADNTDNTKYPDRSAATLTLNGTSTLSIQGTFAGIINCETNENQVIIGPNATTTGVTTNEANGYRTGIKTLTFSIDIRTPAT